MPRNVICISRSFGAAGEEVGRLIAAQLEYRLLDGEILARAAAKGELDPTAVADAEQRRSLTRRLLDAIGHGTAIAPEAYAYMPAHELASGPGENEIRSLIREAIAEVAAEGDAVIVAHAASHALVGREGVLRVLITGSPGYRASRVARESDADLTAAEREVESSDRARAHYLSEFYDVDEEQASQYDIVISTDTLTPSQAAIIVATAASA
jgi:cytidylate kinase